MATTGDGKANIPPVNLNPQAEDCYYYFYSKCTRGDKCSFRHCSAALGSEIVCERWMEGNCTRKICAFRHSVMQRQRSQIPCYWETQPMGCLKPHCPFKHSKPRLALPGTFDRLTQYKEKAFEALNVKSLDEIRTEKLHSTQPPGHPHRIYIPTKKPSFELGSVLEETGIMKAQSNSNTSSSNDTQKHPPAQGTMAVVQTKNIFPGSQDTSSIFSREYRGSVSKEDVEKSSKPQTKQDVNNASSPDRKLQRGGHSNKSTPSQEPKTQVTMTMTSADQETLQLGKLSGKAASQAGQKRSLVAMETKREQPVAKKNKLSHVRGKDGAVQPGNMGFHVKTLDEIRAEKRKRKSEEKLAEEKAQTENTPHSTSPSKPTALTTSRIADSVSCSDPPQPARKKIVLVRKKPQISTTSSSHQKPLSVVASSHVSSSGVNQETSVSDREEQTKINGRTGSGIVEDRPGGGTRSGMVEDRPGGGTRSGMVEDRPGGGTRSGMVEDRPGGGTRSGMVEDRPGVKRIKLSSKSSDEGTIKSIAAENQLSDLSMLVECRPPPNIDTTCIEKSVPQEEGRNADGQGHGQTDTGSSQLAGSVKQLDEMECVQPVEESSPGLRERKESIDAELKGLLSPMEEEEEGRVVGGKRPSIAEMKAEIQSELRRHDSELHGETLDAELEQFEQELMEGGDVTVDSKTDDDLMLEMEEFL